MHSGIILRAAALLLFALAGDDLRGAQEEAAATVSEACAELPFDSYPPNQLLREENPDGAALSRLQSGKDGTWAKFFIQVDRPGTYRVEVDLRKGADCGAFQLQVEGEPIGDPIDCYAAGAESHTTVPVGTVTFLKPGNKEFRFVVTGKNAAASASGLALERIALTPAAGFTLLSPNGSCQADGNVLLRWKAWPQAGHYRLELDGVVVNTVDADTTSFQATGLTAGLHHWQVIAMDKGGTMQPSNTFSFTVGNSEPYPCREFSDDFSSRKADDWTLTSMAMTPAGQPPGLEGSGPASAVQKTIRLDKTESELSARINPQGADSVAGVGFQADDGTQLDAVVDFTRHQLRLERKVHGPGRYSIFDITPQAYQVRGWAERTEGDAIVWEIAACPMTLAPGTAYTLKLAYSRRSACIMATLLPADGSPAVTLRDLTDLRTPDRPLLVALAGKANFGAVALRLLNKLVYKWDPDTTRIVLRPGAPGSWDAKGTFNPAVVVRNGTWRMVYRGNQKPAPPNGPAGSELGLATSNDGVHWTKSPANPIIRKEVKGDGAEDPDLLWPKGSDVVNLEYVCFRVTIGLSPDVMAKDQQSGHWPRAEVIRSSTDFIHWGDPWILNSGKTFGKMCGFIDTQNEPSIPAIQSGGTAYRYVSMIEEGRIDLSNDLHQWTKAGTADLKGTPEAWCNTHECSGDIFVDHDRNIRFESQIGNKPESGKGGGIVGNRLCTIGEGVLSGTDPTRVLWRSDLPWLTDWYGDAPTGAMEDYTATNGSVFPGQTIVKDGWLWHYSGGNNHCTLLTKCWYGPLLECRDLQAASDGAGQYTVSVVARNVGSLAGTLLASLLIDGKQPLEQHPVLERDTEETLHWKISVPAGIHTLSVEDLSLTVKR